MEAETTLAPALVELRVPVATPLALVGPAGCVRLLPLVGLAARTTVAPWIRLPMASLAVTVMVEVLDPVLAVIGVGAALTVDCVAETVPAVMENEVEVAPVSRGADAVSV